MDRSPMERCRKLFRLAALPIAASFALSGCATMGGNASCAAAFPHGMTGTVPTNVCVVYGAWSSDWDLNRRNQVARVDSVYLEQQLQRLAQSNPNGPQFQFGAGENCYIPANGLLLSVVVYGNVHYEDIGFVGGMTGKLWAGAFPTGLGYSHLFNFTTHAYDYAENPDDMPAMYDELANQYYRYVANGWTCGGGR